MCSSDLWLVAAGAAVCLTAVAGAQDQKPADAIGPVWPKLSSGQRADVMRFGDEFKQFIGTAKSEQAFVRETAAQLEAAGFRQWPAQPKKTDATPGSRWYAVNRGRTIAAVVIGDAPVASGVRIVKIGRAHV